jgi:hypothetical protein
VSELALALTLGTANWQLATCNLGLGTWEFGTYFVFCVFLCLCVVVWNGVVRVCACVMCLCVKCEVQIAKKLKLCFVIVIVIIYIITCRLVFYIRAHMHTRSDVAHGPHIRTALPIEHRNCVRW